MQFHHYIIHQINPPLDGLDIYRHIERIDSPYPMTPRESFPRKVQKVFLFIRKLVHTVSNVDSPDKGSIYEKQTASV